MKTFDVEFHYVSNITIRVDANSKEEARQIAGDDAELVQKIMRRIELFDEFVTERSKEHNPILA